MRRCRAIVSHATKAWPGTSTIPACSEADSSRLANSTVPSMQLALWCFNDSRGSRLWVSRAGRPRSR